MDRFEGGTRINYRITENKTQHTENGKSVSRRKMGETLVKFKIYGSDGRFVELEATVDTGATFTKIPESVASELGLVSCCLFFVSFVFFCGLLGL